MAANSRESALSSTSGAGGHEEEEEDVDQGVNDFDSFRGLLGGTKSRLSLGGFGKRGTWTVVWI